MEEKNVSIIIRGNNGIMAKSKSAIDCNLDNDNEEEKEPGISDDISDAVSKLIDEEDE